MVRFNFIIRNETSLILESPRGLESTVTMINTKKKSSLQARYLFKLPAKQRIYDSFLVRIFIFGVPKKDHNISHGKKSTLLDFLTFLT